jgi:VWFA-related protein
VISDGEDNASRISREEMIRTVVRNDVSVVAVYVPAPRPLSVSGSSRSGKANLEKIVEDTGGSFIDSGDLKRFESLRSGLTSQYTVEFQPSNRSTDLRYRKIRIDAVNKDYRIGYRPGYYPR